MNGVLNRHHNGHGAVASETRGGNRKLEKFAGQRTKIIEFCKKLKVVESHYNRHRATYRQYLAPGLTISLLCKIYNGDVEPEYVVKEAFFREVVNKNFNFGFGFPKSDACSTCMYLE